MGGSNLVMEQLGVGGNWGVSGGVGGKSSCRQVPVLFMQYSPKLHEIRPAAQLQVAGKILRFIRQGLWIQQNEQNRVYWVVC